MYQLIYCRKLLRPKVNFWSSQELAAAQLQQRFIGQNRIDVLTMTCWKKSQQARFDLILGLKYWNTSNTTCLALEHL